MSNPLERASLREFLLDQGRALCAINRTSIALGYGDLRRLRKEAGNLDPSKVRGLDDLAAMMHRRYPEFLSCDESDAERKLFDLLIETNWAWYDKWTKRRLCTNARKAWATRRKTSCRKKRR